MAERTKTQARRHMATPHSDGDTSPTYIQLAGDALLGGMTREQVIAGLISRSKRDQGYLAYRKACNRRTSYDGQVQQDMRALALAVCGLQEQSGAPGRAAHSAAAVPEQEGGDKRHDRPEEQEC